MKRYNFIFLVLISLFFADATLAQKSVVQAIVLDAGHGGKSLANPLPTLPKSAAIPRQKVRDRFFISTNSIPDLPRWYQIHINLWSLD